mgnify:CR=1 FL=1
MGAQLDHLVITAATLEQGCEQVKRWLGVEPGSGGAHERMATHNRLMRLGPTVYLEVIAPNPLAPPPTRPRWFGMDDPSRLAHPRLATWVARTSSIAELCQRLPIDPGPVHPMRRGEWEWQITISDDGQPALQGVLPTLIEWQGDRHPTAFMNDWSCHLLCLELHHPDPQLVKNQMTVLALSGDVAIEVCKADSAPGLRAVIQTPTGVRVIEGFGQF